jgi:hypothetical protein
MHSLRGRKLIHSDPVDGVGELTSHGCGHGTMSAPLILF